jgi:hypothetical protein
LTFDVILRCHILKRCDIPRNFPGVIRRYPLVLHDVAAPQNDFLVSATKMSFE